MTTVVRCGTLIDGRGDEPLRDATVVIEGDSIVAANRDGSIPRGADVVDAGGMTVMPGMIDCHVHLTAERFSPQVLLMSPYSLAVARALANARRTLEAGFTSLRDAGMTPRGVKLAIDQGLFPGPRLRVAVGILSQSGGHGDQTMPNGAHIMVAAPDCPSGVCDGIAGVRQKTREMLRAGADQIKVCTSGGVLSPNDEPGATGFSPEEIATIVYEARAAGRTVMAHAQATQGIKNAVLGGIASIEHGIFLDEEIVDEMKRRGTYLVPTLVAPIWVLRNAEQNPGSMPDYAVRKTHEVLQAHKANISMAIARGVKIAMGTDSGVGPHAVNAEELQLMVECGMTPMQAIMATTKTAAECANIGHLTGTIEPGKRADLLAIDGDPLSDIAVLQQKERLALIMKDGAPFKNALESRTGAAVL
jgi:imidazolonepropionase-like amidohydrolase